MCTAIRFNERYFGRTLDYEKSFGESLVVTPREKMQILGAANRYAMMGVGVILGDTPMYFDGVNEWGLTAAALNFPGYAVYRSSDKEGSGIPSGELISHILGLCRSVSEVRDMLGKIAISDSAAEGHTKPSPLHWIIADGRECAVVEAVAEGLRICNNPVGVLTNAPDFNYHLTRLADFSSLRAENPRNGLSGSKPYSRGMGAIGLPGDFSSSSRFVRAVFLRDCCFGRMSADDIGEVSRAFSVLSSLSIPIGTVLSDDGRPVFTRYTALVDLAEPSYYLTTASCRTVLHIRLNDGLCDGKGVQSYPIYRKEAILPLVDISGSSR